MKLNSELKLKEPTSYGCLMAECLCRGKAELCAWMDACDCPANPQVSNDSQHRAGTSICCPIPCIVNYHSSGSFTSEVIFLFVLEAKSGSIVTKHNSPTSISPSFYSCIGELLNIQTGQSIRKWPMLEMASYYNARCGWKCLKIIQDKQIPTRSQKLLLCLSGPLPRSIHHWPGLSPSEMVAMPLG